MEAANSEAGEPSDEVERMRDETSNHFHMYLVTVFAFTFVFLVLF